MLLLIVGEATQQGLTGKDYSVTNAFVIVVTLIGSDIGLSLLKQRSPKLDKLLESTSLVIVENGRPIKQYMDKARVDEADIMGAARLLQGLERMDQIQYAVLERDGSISIIPKPGSREQAA